ncbi:MAG: polyprenyl synthetase family protein [Nitrospinota bacterium]|nr:polyprenyl synthetase family protein [Nitrospinota bacterium]
MHVRENAAISGIITPADIQDILKKELAAVETSISENFQSSVAMIPLISEYLVSGGGKRLRPMLLLASARLCGFTGKENDKDIIHSTIMEYIHAASLLHDDVVDTADLRRGVSSANAKWGNQYPVLVGDFLFAKTFSLMAKHSPPGVIEIVSEATRLLAEGQILELVHSADIEMTEEKYIELIFSKTGALITACCQTGGIIGGADEQRLNALSEYGKNIGIAFQLVDDILDFTSDEKTLGKPAGHDFIEGHVTLPVIAAFAKGSKQEKKFLMESIKDEALAVKNISQVMEIVKKHDGIEYATTMAESYSEKAVASLDVFPAGQFLDALKGLAEYIVTRKT